MILPKPQDIFHKTQLYRLLTEIVDNSFLATNLYFKGGTCASMLGWLDRFSLDLDFDLQQPTQKKKLVQELRKIFKYLNLEIKDQSQKALVYVLRYENKDANRNTVRLEIIDNKVKSNIYQSVYFSEIDRFINSQTKETMFANKLVGLTDRFKKHGQIAGRDVYDIHHFFLEGFTYSKEIIEERTGESPKKYFRKIHDFIKIKITEKIINEDLNFLLPAEKFMKIRKFLILETLRFIEEEIEKLN